MRRLDADLLTPIYVKTDVQADPPADEAVCYLLAGNGKFICRNHEFFTSCVETREWPAELAPQRQYLRLHCPRLPRRAMERIVGFFSRIADLHGSEAAAILYWDRRSRTIDFRIPEQTAVVEEGWAGGLYPCSVKYTIPPAGPGRSVFGSVHSHVDGPAYSSHVDRDDESYRTGLHVVIGRIHDEPPEIHCVWVVDGARFRVDTRGVIEGYRRREAEVPEEWIRRVRVEVRRYESRSVYYRERYD